MPESSAPSDDSVVLENIAAHLRRMAEELSGLGNAVSVVVQADKTACRSPEHITQLQKIDYLHQSLQDLARLNDALATSGANRLAVLKHLKMDTTRGLLDGTPPSEQAVTGIIDWF